MKTQPCNSHSNSAYLTPNRRFIRNGVKARHHIRTNNGEIEILSTEQVVDHAKEVLQVVDFPNDDLDALARGYVDIWNSAYPDDEVCLPGRVASDFISELIGYAFMLTRVVTDVEGAQS
jgi:hypothetical protein